MTHKTLLFALRAVLPIIGIFACAAVPLARAEYPDFTTFIESLNGKELISLSATWNGQSISSSTPLTATSTQWVASEWSVATDPGNANLAGYLASLANGTYTLQLYKGTLGNSTLIASTTLSPTATSSGVFTYPMPRASGHYFYAYTITYPADTYPLSVRKCLGNDGVACFYPHYSLDDFTRFAEMGMTEDAGDYGFPIPAILGILPFGVRGLGPTASNVLFLPGTMESRLYSRDDSGKEHMLWEPTRNKDIPPLALHANGQGDETIYTRDIVDYVYSTVPLLKTAVAKVAKDGAVMYGPFEDFMNSLVANGTIHTWKAFPYDWRYDVSDIVHDGVLVASATSPLSRVFLADTIQQLAADSPTGKVTIIAHSNGGLLAKALAVYLEEHQHADLIDQIILVGSPQFGTPASIGNMLHGDGQTRALGIVTSGATMRTTAATLPGPYDLFPSKGYFSYVATPVVQFASDTTSAPYQHAYGTPIQTYDAFADYLTDRAGVHASAREDDLQTPVAARPELLAKAEATHAAIDAWVPPATLALTSITGMGQATISGYTYAERAHGRNCSLAFLTIDCTKEYVLSHTPTITTQGDDTVVSISAAGNPGTQFYFDAQQFEKDSGKHIVHQSLLSAAPVQSTITSLLTGRAVTQSYVSRETPSYNIIPSLVVSTHSPVNMTVTDSAGRMTGTVAIPEIDFPIISEEIPGSSVQIIDDEKYLYLPLTTEPYSVQVYGTGIGNTTIEIGSVNAAGGITPHASFADLATTASTSASFTIEDNSPSPLSWDTFGTGSSTMIQSLSESETDSTQLTKNSLTETVLTRAGGGFGSHASNTTDTQLIYYLRLMVTYLKLKLQLVKLHLIPIR